MKRTKILLILAIIIIIVFGIKQFYPHTSKVVEPIEKQTETKPELSETNEFYYKNYETTIKTIQSKFVIRDYFKAKDLSQYAKGCDKNLSVEYFNTLLNKFSETEIGSSYLFTYDDNQNIGYKITLIPNRFAYENLEQFNNDFESCLAGGELYPKNLSEKYLLFESSCGSGMEDSSIKICDEIKEKINQTIKLK
ncbi:hypothetical protein K8R66_03330 [bacterium]|nr:hypothetical protein [bacterium]